MFYSIYSFQQQNIEQIVQSSTIVYGVTIAAVVDLSGDLQKKFLAYSLLNNNHYFDNSSGTVQLMNLRNQAISALESLHQRGDEVDRCNVIRTLGVLKASESIPILIQSLRDEDLDVCIDAAENLGKIGAVDSVSALIESLENDPDGEIRTIIVAALGEIATCQAAVQTGDSEADKAVEALLKIAHQRPENLEWLGEWDDYWDMQLNAVKALGKLGVRRAVPIMEEIISSDDHQDIESEVLTALAQIGSEGHALLEKRLKEGAARERRRAAQALGHATTPESLSMLSQGLLDSEAEVRGATLQALAQRQATQYMKAILIYLRDPDPEVKAAAMAAIAQLGESSGNVVHPEQLNDKLFPLLSDPDPDVRTAALKFIANYHQAGQFSKPLQQAILKAVADPVSGVAEAACDTVAKLQYEAAIPDLQLILRKQDLHPAVRRQAALALSKMPSCSPETVKALTEAIGAPQQPLRLGALQALSQLYADAKTDDDGVLGTLIAASHRELLKEQLEEREIQQDDTAAVADEENQKAEADAQADTQVDAHPEPESEKSAAEAEAATESTAKPQSTLDAIMQSNVEGEKVYQQQLDAERSATVSVDQTADQNPDQNTAQNPAQSTEQSEDDAIQDYYNILNRQKAGSKRRKKITALPLAQDVQLLAIRMLANLDNETALEPLLELLQSEDELVQKEAAASIEELAKKTDNKSELINIFGALMNRLEYGDPATQIHAARALGHLGHPEALNLLQRNALSGESAVRIAALEGINQLLQQSVSEAESEEQMVSEPVVYGDLFDVIGQSMSDNETGVRIAAAEALTNAREHQENRFDHQQLVGKLIESALQGEGGQARHMGQLLRHFDSELSMPQLLSKLEESDQSVERRFIIEMIEELLTHNLSTTI